MATETYFISSYYVPPGKDDANMRQTAYGRFSTYEDNTLSAEGRWSAFDDEEEAERIWTRGSTYRANYKIYTGPTYTSDRAAHPPKFVAALRDGGLQPSTSNTPNAVDTSSQAVSSWYKFIRTSDIADVEHDVAPTIIQPSSQIITTSPPDKSYLTPSLPSLSSVPTSTASTHALVADGSSQAPPSKKALPSSKPGKPDWFIQSALRSSSLFSDSSPTTLRTSSMTDILSRAPPPLPSEAPFKPITYTKLGPLNKGYTILEKSGWREGEGLGAWRRPTQDSSVELATEKSPERDSTPRPGEAASDVIDLTLSSGSDDEAEGRDRPTGLELLPPVEMTGMVLLQPIPTYLRPDRLGIGASLKKGDSLAQKTKLVDTSQAMHVSRNRKELNRAKQSRQSALISKQIKGGKKGARAFKTMRNDEEWGRRDLLAYMNS